MTLTLHKIPANHFVAMETDGVVEEPHVTFDGDERPSFFPLVFSSVAVADFTELLDICAVPIESPSHRAPNLANRDLCSTR